MANLIAELLAKMAGRTDEDGMAQIEELRARGRFGDDVARGGVELSRGEPGLLDRIGEIPLIGPVLAITADAVNKTFDAFQKEGLTPEELETKHARDDAEAKKKQEDDKKKAEQDPDGVELARGIVALSAAAGAAIEGVNRGMEALGVLDKQQAALAEQIKMDRVEITRASHGERAGMMQQAMENAQQHAEVTAAQVAAVQAVQGMTEQANGIFASMMASMQNLNPANVLGGLVPTQTPAVAQAVEKGQGAGIA